MHVSQPDISLYLTHHTVAEIDNTLTATNTTHNGAHEHLYHPNMHIKLNFLRMLNTSIHPTNTHGLSHRIIYHHLLISSRSPLAPLSRSLSLIMYTAIYPLTPISQRIPQHNLHLFLNPYKGSPYLQYTYEGGRHHQCPVSAQRLTIYISLSSALLFHQVTKMTMCDAHHVSHA